jgi:CelD/BcsL family acetyltransferase involved in cellulose biosynthesis
MPISDELLTNLTASSPDLSVIETNPRNDPRWESFLLDHPNGSIYHHPAWLEALEREYGQKGHYFICENASGRVLAILPMLQTRGLPFGLGGALAGRRFSSLPRTPVAGPLSIDPRATAALLQEAVQRVNRSPRVRLQLKTQERELDGLVDGVVGAPWRLTYILQLPARSEKPFRISNSHHRAIVKWAINKAERVGVHVRPAETKAELGAWYRLYLDTMRRNVVPPRPYRFFVALWELLRPLGLMQLLLAEQESMGQRRIIAGAIFLTLGKTASYSFSGSGLGDASLRPNDLIIWQAINDACKRDCQLFDFGEVPEGNDDLAKFKTKWGAEPVRLHRYYYPSGPDVKSNSDESRGRLEALARAAWRRLPLWTISWLGDRIYARL